MIPLLLILIAAAVFFYVYNRKHPKYLAAEDTLAVHFIDVGQGDCTLLAADDQIMLVDCGEYQASSDVVDYLKERGVERIDCLVATHPHSDHMGGMARIIDEFEIGEVVMPHIDDKDIPTAVFFEKFLDACEKEGCPVSEAELGREISIGDARAKIIAPNSDSYDDVNNYSIALMVSHGKKSFLLTGDAETLSEREMIKGGYLHHVDVYKAGHHGSSSSSSKAFLREITPDAAVISCGAGNSYGHPTDAALKRLYEYTSEIYRTDLNGSVVFESDGEKIKVMTER